MKSGLSPAFVFRWLLSAALAGLAAVPIRADEPAPSPAPVLSPPQIASLDALDRALGRFEALLARDDDAAHQAATRARFDELKKRRDALHQAFDQSKYDDLRTELNLEYQRLAAWVASPIGPPPGAKAAPIPSGG